MNKQQYEVKLRLPPSWREPLQQWAASERRSPTQLIRNIIDDAIKAKQQSAAGRL
jgi:hypothetical protein